MDAFTLARQRSGEAAGCRHVAACTLAVVMVTILQPSVASSALLGIRRLPRLILPDSKQENRNGEQAQNGFILVGLEPFFLFFFQMSPGSAGCAGTEKEGF